MESAGSNQISGVSIVRGVSGLLPNCTARQKAVITIFLLFWSLLMLWLCWWSGAKHDYGAYLDQWRLLRDGRDPWLPEEENTYGPLHAVLGLLLPLGKLAPKFFIVSSLLIANAALVFALIRERGIEPIQVVYLAAIPTNILVIGVGVAYGLNDALVAGILVFAALLRIRRVFAIAGMLVGLAALTKFYPLLLLPFFALDRGRLRWSVVLSGISVFCVGFAVAVVIWGYGPVAALAYGSAREPKLLSILAALENYFGEKEVVRWLIKYNSICVVFGVAITFLLSLWARLNWLEGTVLGYLVMLTAYKVGHQQFYVPWLFMVASLPLINKQNADRMATILLPAILLLSIYQFGYEFGSNKYRDEYSWVRSYGGAIAFLVSSASIVACVWPFGASNGGEQALRVNSRASGRHASACTETESSSS
jgi:hypothetical protein